VEVGFSALYKLALEVDSSCFEQVLAQLRFLNSQRRYRDAHFKELKHAADQDP